MVSLCGSVVYGDIFNCRLKLAQARPTIILNDTGQRRLTEQWEWGLACDEFKFYVDFHCIGLVDWLELTESSWFIASNCRLFIARKDKIRFQRHGNLGGSIWECMLRPAMDVFGENNNDHNLLKVTSRFGKSVHIYGKIKWGRSQFFFYWTDNFLHSLDNVRENIWQLTYKTCIAR
jgi:hypothetical protein